MQGVVRYVKSVLASDPMTREWRAADKQLFIGEAAEGELTASSSSSSPAAVSRACDRCHELAERPPEQFSLAFFQLV
jgi:cytochrome c553